MQVQARNEPGGGPFGPSVRAVRRHPARGGRPGLAASAGRRGASGQVPSRGSRAPTARRSRATPSTARSTAAPDPSPRPRRRATPATDALRRADLPLRRHRHQRRRPRVAEATRRRSRPTASRRPRPSAPRPTAATTRRLTVARPTRAARSPRSAVGRRRVRHPACAAAPGSPGRSSVGPFDTSRRRTTRSPCGRRTPVAGIHRVSDSRRALRAHPGADRLSQQPQRRQPSPGTWNAPTNGRPITRPGSAAVDQTLARPAPLGQRLNASRRSPSPSCRRHVAGLSDAGDRESDSARTPDKPPINVTVSTGLRPPRQRHRRQPCPQQCDFDATCSCAVAGRWACSGPPAPGSTRHQRAVLRRPTARGTTANTATRARRTTASDHGNGPPTCSALTATPEVRRCSDRHHAARQSTTPSAHPAPKARMTVTQDQADLVRPDLRQLVAQLRQGGARQGARHPARADLPALRGPPAARGLPGHRQDPARQGALAPPCRARNSRIQFTPDLLPSDVTGVTIYDQGTKEFEFHQGPIFATIVLADEINRASPKTQSALLEVMEEGRVTVDGVPHAVGEPFMVIATQNPDRAGRHLPAARGPARPLPDEDLVGYPDHEATVASSRDAKTRDRTKAPAAGRHRAASSPTWPSSPTRCTSTPRSSTTCRASPRRPGGTRRSSSACRCAAAWRSCAAPRPGRSARAAPTWSPTTSRCSPSRCSATACSSTPRPSSPGPPSSRSSPRSSPRWHHPGAPRVMTDPLDDVATDDAARSDLGSRRGATRTAAPARRGARRGGRRRRAGPDAGRAAAPPRRRVRRRRSTAALTVRQTAAAAGETRTRTTTLPRVRCRPR